MYAKLVYYVVVIATQAIYHSKAKLGINYIHARSTLRIEIIIALQYMLCAMDCLDCLLPIVVQDARKKHDESSRMSTAIII